MATALTNGTVGILVSCSTPARPLPFTEGAVAESGTMSKENEMLKVEWDDIECAPKDGSWIVALNKTKTHIGIYRWSSAEENAERENGDPDDFIGCWVDPKEDYDEPMYQPVWWVDYGVLV